MDLHTNLFIRYFFGIGLVCADTILRPEDFYTTTTPSLDDLDVINLQTPIGTIRGSVERSSAPARPYYAFKKIPYAKPPIGDLRFKDPEIQLTWEGELDGRQYGHSCPQFSYFHKVYEGNEDCLHLNIFTPKIPGDANVIEAEPTAKSDLPVMVFIHGGGFIIGASFLHGPEKFMREDIVLVTINYRLGVFGFLSTGDTVMPGNFGMLDQITALKWIKQNIRHFGGDPEKVTIFGESAGGASVHLLLLSPLAEGLFHQAIAMSGTATCGWSIEPSPAEFAKQFAEHFGCSVDTSQSILDCLNQRTSKDLIIGHNDINNGTLRVPLKLVPVVDTGSRSQPFLPDLPRILMKEGRYTKVPLIIGLTKHEGFFFALDLIAHMKKEENNAVLDAERVKKALHPVVKSLLPSTMQQSSEQNDAQSETVLQHYLDAIDLTDHNQAFKAISEMLGDAMFVGCTEETIQIHKQTSDSPIWTYVFSHRGSPTIGKLLIWELESKGFNVEFFHQGVSHADDILYLFNFLGGQPETRQDRLISKYFVHLWAKFAVTGDPSGGMTEQWVKDTGESVNYFEISSQADSKMIGEFRNEANEFWRSLS